MANTFGIYRIYPAYGRAESYTPKVVYRPVGAGTFFQGAVVRNDGAGNVIEDTIDTVTAVKLGIALANYQAVYNLPLGSGTMEPVYSGTTARFGFDISGGVYNFGDIYQIPIAAGISGTVFEGTGVLAVWAASMVGGKFALEKDATSGYWVVDLSDTVNAAVQIVALQQMPLLLSNGTGYGIPAVGDTNVRILFSFLNSVLDPSVASL